MTDSEPVIHKCEGSDILTEVLTSSYHLNALIGQEHFKKFITG